MDAYKGEIFKVYIVDKGTQSDVQDFLRHNYGLDVK